MTEPGLLLVSVGGTMLGVLNLIQYRRLHDAQHDPLTRLPARRVWMGRADRAVRRSRCSAVLIVDGDGVKQINDRYGHEAGDALLMAHGRRLQAWTGSRGLAGRLGGDEFAAFVRLTDRNRLADELDVLSAELCAPVRYGDETLRAGASIGAVIVDELPTPTLHDALRAADTAMYRAKNTRRGTWHICEPSVRPFSRAGVFSATLDRVGPL